MDTLRTYADHSPDERVIYLITDMDVQAQAMVLIRRSLTDDELRTAKKGIESGLGSGLDVVINTAIEEAVS